MNINQMSSEEVGEKCDTGHLT